MDRVQPDLTAGGLPARRYETALLVAGDILVFLIFSWIGRRSHAEPVGLDAIGQIVATAAPFLTGWFVVSPFAGAYRPGMGPAQMTGRTALAWLLALPLGLALRALAMQRWSAWLFAVITGVTVLVLLVLWRGLFAWFWGRQGAREGQ